MTSLPPLPPGFQLQGSAPASMPPLPPGFQLAQPEAPAPLDINATRAALMAAHDSGNLAEERRLSALLKPIDAPSRSLGETTVKPVSADSFYQPGFKPLDEAAATVSTAVNQLPLVGAPIEQGIATLQANAHNAMKPNDLPISASDVVSTNRQREQQNPKGNLAGKVIGGIAPYAVASEFALPAKLLGLEGSILSRIGFGTFSQFGINTGDNMTRNGQSFPEAAANAIVPTLLSLPLSLFGSPTRPGKIVTNELKRAGLTQEDVDGLLKQLGPEAVIGDLTPRLQARTGAIATTDGPGRDLVVKALTARAAGANKRIKSATESIFGPEPVPSRVADDIEAARKNANAAYEPVFREKALSGATPADAQFDAQPLSDAINAAIPNFVGETRSKVASVAKMLVDPRTGKLTTDPQTILAVRGELDGMIGALKDQRGSKTTADALMDLRKVIDDDLALQVPGVKWADAGRAEVAAQQRGFELGRDSLKNGESAIHPVDFKNELNDLAGPSGTAIGPRATPSIAPQRVSEGMLSRIYQAIGVTANDRVALKQLLKGDGSWNREKMEAAFGPEKTDQFVKLLDNEATMAETEGLAFGNSKTSLLHSAKSGLEPATNAGMIRSALNARFGDAAVQALDRATFGLASAERKRTNTQVAKALMGRGVPTTENGRLALTAVARALLVQQGLSAFGGNTSQ